MTKMPPKNPPPQTEVRTGTRKIPYDPVLEDACNNFQQIGKSIIAHRIAQLKINKVPWWKFRKRRKQHIELKQGIALYAAGTAIRNMLNKG